MHALLWKLVVFTSVLSARSERSESAAVLKSALYLKIVGQTRTQQNNCCTMVGVHVTTDALHDMKTNRRTASV